MESGNYSMDYNTTILLSDLTSIPSLLSNQKQPMQKQSPLDWRIIFGVTIFVTALVGNLILMALILFDRQLRKLEHVPIASLCVVNILTAVMIIMPFFMFLIHRKWVLGQAWCYLWNPMGYFLPSTGIFHYMIISIDRYLRVTRPLEVTKTKTKRLLILQLILSWIIPAIVSYLPEMIWRQFDFTYSYRCYYKYHRNNMLIYNSVVVTVLFGLPLFVTTAIYIKLTRIALGHSRTIKLQRLSIASQQSQEKSTRKLRHQSKGEIILAFLLLAFVICWLPTLIYALVSSITYPKDPSRKIPWLYPMLLVINFCYPTVNPIMFGLLYRPVRRALVKQYCKVCRFNTFMDRTTTMMSSISRSSIAMKNSNSLSNSQDRRVLRRLRSSNSSFNPSDTLSSIRDHKRPSSSCKDNISYSNKSSPGPCSPTTALYRPFPKTIIDQSSIYIRENVGENVTNRLQYHQQKANRQTNGNHSYKNSHSSSTSSGSMQYVDINDNMFYNDYNQETNV
ncbi:5-hydroxytryptamine receptor 4 [Trichoplax sp. H2]|nr:5-hydroxytryptamine receptor 4 [Trichoplax sp. H2]|eukprot:RDD40303.1 5-hydroxytryptamine receptor 4 [Trichoplax sp. H2]